MARIHTHYDNLKVARDAPPEVIRAAYKTLSQKHHPDRNGNSPDAIRIIQLINNAYEVLSDPIKRQEHDAWIARAESGARANASSGGFGFAPPDASSHRVRRSKHSAFHRSRYKPSSQWAKAMQTAAIMWEHFYRKVFKKV